jgi:DNA-directed RNA polymerase II subunit RPB2
MSTREKSDKSEKKRGKEKRREFGSLESNSNSESISWNIIERYFKDNPYNLVAHHLDSYNDFFNKGIFQIFLENNPIRFIERDDDIDNEKRNQCLLYLGGKKADKIYFGKPIIYDDSTVNGLSEPYPHYMYPNDARLRNMTYGITIHYDVEVEFIYYKDGEKVEATKILEKVYLGRFPIMLHSNLCILKGLAIESRFNLGECRNDYGGYFIIDGKEKCILSQEKFADNMLFVKKNKADNMYSLSCEVRSVSEDSSKPIRYSSVKMVAPDAFFTNNQIVVDIPNIKKPVPLFILMRALGVVSDKKIIEYCLLDLDANSNMIDLFIPSVHDASKIFTQQTAFEYLRHLTKRTTVTAVIDILMNYFLPHIGEDNFLNKAYYVGFMVNKLLRVHMGREKPTDRDNFKFKRVEISGTLIYDLFREYFLLQNRAIFLKVDKTFYYHPEKYRANFTSLIEDNYKEFFKERTIEEGFKRGFKGNWGSDANTKKIGLVQDVNRLSWFTFISILRKIILPLDSSSKAVAPHMLHSSQWGIIDPVDTPDGGNIGLHKHMAISTSITNGTTSIPLIKWLRANTALKLLQECTTKSLAAASKMFVNGNWIGVIDNPIETVNILKLFRRNGVIPVYTSISFSYESNVIYLYTDGGRLTRPIYYRNNGDTTNLSFDNTIIRNKIESRQYTWSQVVSGFEPKADEGFSIRNNILYDTNVLYPGFNTLKDLLDMFEEKKGIVDFMDTSEAESSLISMYHDKINENKLYTHAEIDPSLMFGVLGNSIIFPEANQFPRNAFSCGQSKQAVSMYHSNYQMRADKMGVVLLYGQTPLIKSRYLEYINREEQPYGVNAIVAIMSYTGYNVEDAMLINKGSVDRGIFRTSYFTSYEAREESAKVSGTTTNSFFSNIEAKPKVNKLKEGYDYSKLDEYGLVKENTMIDEKIVLIGKLNSNVDSKGEYTDDSSYTKKGQLGYVDKSFISEGEEGFRIAKIRIREERMPAIGDKMASRCGQKGTIGLIVAEEDMPFTADGIRPDLIINPHALPSRMTIGQLIESLFGKACATYGAYGDCTAFRTKGSNYPVYGEMLTRMNYHCSGNQLMYNGFTGEQIYSEIYIGPTYYMRLKHMVKDKINYRATGKRSVLTRQTNQGRANDGGLKIGEMERDGIMANGLSYFLNESYMVRGDQYYMAVCNKTGTIAIYNTDKNLFISPFSDGPLTFNKGIDGEPVLDVFSKFGRSFSILRIPYALKLMMQELQVLNVQMRIITEQNVDQLLNLSYQSRNIDKLLHLPENSDEAKNDIKAIVANYKTQTVAKNNILKKEYNTYNSQQQILQGEISNPVPQGMTEADLERNNIEPPTEWGNEHVDNSPFEWSNPNINLENAEFPVSNSTNPRVVKQAQLGDWVPADEGNSASPSSSPNSQFSPGYAPLSPAQPSSPIPNFPDEMMKQEWSKLPYYKQQDILNHPLDEQITIMKQIISDRPTGSNTGSNFEDAELQKYFTQLPKEEQIELLKLSHERQIDKLKELSRTFRPEPGIKIVVPKTAAENLYEGKLSLLAPSEMLKAPIKTNDQDIVAADSGEPSKGGTKKITIH